MTLSCNENKLIHDLKVCNHASHNHNIIECREFSVAPSCSHEMMKILFVDNFFTSLADVSIRCSDILASNTKLNHVTHVYTYTHYILIYTSFFLYTDTEKLPLCFSCIWGSLRLAPNNYGLATPILLKNSYIGYSCECRVPCSHEMMKILFVHKKLILPTFRSDALILLKASNSMHNASNIMHNNNYMATFM